MENGITGKCEEVCLVVRIGSLGTKKDRERGKFSCCILNRWAEISRIFFPNNIKYQKI